MNRTWAFVFALWLLLGSTTASRAQYDEAGRYDGGAYDYGVYSYDEMPSGAFGLNYVQVVPSGRLMIDRFGMVYQAPMVGGESAVSLARPNVRARGEARSMPARRRAAARTPRRAQTIYPLPTGSLDWPAGQGVLLYSPALRYQSYGGGAARSPHGTIEYGSMYKGWLLSD
jgi:hypothetical protein